MNQEDILKRYESSLRTFLRKIGLRKTPGDIENDKISTRKNVIASNKNELIKRKSIKNLKQKHTRTKKNAKKALKKIKIIRPTKKINNIKLKLKNTSNKIKKELKEQAIEAKKETKKLIRSVYKTTIQKEAFVRRNLRKANDKFSKKKYIEAEEIYYKIKIVFDKLPNKSKAKFEKPALKLKNKLTKHLK